MRSRKEKDVIEIFVPHCLCVLLIDAGVEVHIKEQLNVYGNYKITGDVVEDLFY